MPNGTCPAKFVMAGSFCGPALDGGTCGGDSIRLCEASETCPVGTTCKRLVLELGGGLTYESGGCF